MNTRDPIVDRPNDTPPTQHAPTGPASPKPEPASIGVWTREEIAVWTRGLHSILKSAKDELPPDTMVGAKLDMAIQFVDQIDLILIRSTNSGPLPPLPVPGADPHRG